ncbi:DUF4376 domain-containing protein [Oxalobacter aliiformigenes]|uniref:DUF4376 domain-containing protein n=1 Tax=Oxalobacter aliiformigenes TaxID=2946593 RepID=UPI0022AFB278|nr:DUF4376 domain-containing protein [Oxalobacter aliiformigenes]MCZ4065738.1 DUF4376 domain-containing protein [Oxalobacter aliiformigenes]WAV98630.1 DUF4376 domain-containing protein [Oxalobacter aliiformigenes]
MYALIEKASRKVISTTPTFFDVPSGYSLISCPDDILPGDEYLDGKFVKNNRPAFDDRKTARLAELNDAFEEAAKTAHLMSSVGFEIDANETANRDIEGLTLVMNDTDTTLFCDYNNQFHEVTKADLETMRREIVANSQRLYQIKWQYRSLIEAATTVEELDAITITFGEA